MLLGAGAARYAQPVPPIEKPPPLMRQIVLDTETTGLEPAAGHRIIEIGCVELVNRRPTQNRFHRYINPEREVDRGALEVHGIENDFLATQPKFAEVAREFVEFVTRRRARHSQRRLRRRVPEPRAEAVCPDLPGEIRDCCGVLDTLALARRLHPGQRNSLDALAKRYSVDNSKRELHGALLDAQILADIYLAMTGGQVSLSLDSEAPRTAATGGAELDDRPQRARPRRSCAATPRRSARTRPCWPSWRSAASRSGASSSARRPPSGAAAA